VVYPEGRRVTVYRADGTVARLGENDWLSGERILPEFSVRVADLLPKPLVIAPA
jgi:Uma2 family endonuclease